MRRKPMIALEEGFHTVRRKVVFRVQPFGCVALAADVYRDFDWQAPFKRNDAVLGMAICASRRVTLSGGDGFAVNAFSDVPGGLVVAGAAGLSQARIVQRGIGRSWRGYCVAIVAIGARCRTAAALGESLAMNAGAVSFGLLLMAFRAVRRFHRDVVIRMLGSYVRMAAPAGVGFVDRSGEFRRVHEKRNFPARRVGFRQRFVRMAIETGAVGEGSAWTGN